MVGRLDTQMLSLTAKGTPASGRGWEGGRVESWDSMCVTSMERKALMSGSIELRWERVEVRREWGLAERVLMECAMDEREGRGGERRAVGELEGEVERSRSMRWVWSSGLVR